MTERSWIASSAICQLRVLLLVLDIAGAFICVCQGRLLLPAHNFSHLFPPVPSPASPWRMHTLFSVECNHYFDWQTVGLMHSLRKSRHPGPVTRLLSCTDEKLERYQGMDLAPTHIVPSMSSHPVTHDWYPAINKPAGVVHWLNHNSAADEVDWVLILDADMVVRSPILPQEVGAGIGRPASASYEYLIGCDNELAQLHTKHPEYCDKVGGFILMHISDLRVMAPLWLSKTEEVRADKAHWLTNITGDIYGHGWISEMYGYSFGAADVGLRHIINDTLMMYPGYVPADGVEPQLLHYGLRFDVGKWHFSKGEYHDVNIVYDCYHFFPAPPYPQQVRANESDARIRRGLLLSVECVNTINEGLFLQYRLSNCSKVKPSRYMRFLAESILQASSRAQDTSSEHRLTVALEAPINATSTSMDDDFIEQTDEKPDQADDDPVELSTAVPHAHPKIHTLFSVECSPYFDWQTVGMVHSFTLSGQPGSITRLLSCTDEQVKSYRGFDLAPTHVVPSMSRHPLTGDWYPAINKPAAIVHWLNHVETDAEFVVILDADMILRGQITPWEFGARRKYPVSAPYDYLIGCDNELAKLHTRYPKACQKVGGVIVMHIDDLRQFAPLWLHKTEEVRADKAHWNSSITGDIYEQGWISEMYGYVFGAAELKLKHIIRRDVMLYPGYVPLPDSEPRVLHYGLEWKVGNWSFDKAVWREEDMTNNCWRFFPEPPDESTLEQSDDNNIVRRDRIAVECVRTLNEALYFHHLRQGCQEGGDGQTAQFRNRAEEQGQLEGNTGDGDDDTSDAAADSNITVAQDREERKGMEVPDKVEGWAGSVSNGGTVAVPVSPRYWKVALWALLVSFFLVLVSTVSRHHSSGPKSSRSQRSRQKGKQLDTQSSNSSTDLPLSSEAQGSYFENAVP